MLHSSVVFVTLAIMHIELPHKFTKQQAIQHIKQMLDTHRAELAQHASFTKEEWIDDVFEFGVNLQGKNISGTLTVTDSQYVVDATLPFLWRMFEGRIEAEVKKQVERLNG